MKNNITITRLGKIELSESISNKIIELTSKVSWIQKEKLKKNTSNKINSFLFTSILCEIQKQLDELSSSKLNINYNLVNKDNCFKILLDELLKNYQEEENKYLKLKKALNKNKDFTVLNIKNTASKNEQNINLIINLIEFAYNINNLEFNIYYLNDLYQTKQDLEIDLNYFLPQEQINIYKDKFQQCIKKADMKSAKNIIIAMQKLVLQEWQQYPTNINNFINGKDFSFICHSTNNTSFSSKFYSNYISCSLFNQDIHQPFNKGFGFIMAPYNIVGANSRDMYINNYAKKEEELQNSTLIPTIAHPQRILEECTKLKNKHKNTYTHIYNEIVIKGFSPIAIFSLTNGTKELDPNYLNARKLQKDFPNLKIIDIDILKYDKDIDLIDDKITTIINIENILSKKDKNYEPDIINKSTIHKYELFFQQLNSLKNKDTYTKEEIINIFKLNCNLINSNLKNSEIFNGNYTNEEIKYILRKNPKFNIDKILEGNFNYGDFKILIDSLEKDTKNLNNYFPGLEEFAQITLIAKPYILYETQINNLKNLNPLNFYTMSKFILENILNNQPNYTNINKPTTTKLK